MWAIWVGIARVKAAHTPGSWQPRLIVRAVMSLSSRRAVTMMDCSRKNRIASVLSHFTQSTREDGDASSPASKAASEARTGTCARARSVLAAARIA